VPFEEKVRSGQFVWTCEVDPPKVPRLSVTIDRLAPFVHRLDALSISENPLAGLRMDALAAAAILMQRFDNPVVMHLTCRDSSLLGLHSRLMGAWALGVRSVLCLTGDRPNLGTFKEMKGAYPYNSIGLVKTVRELNRGRTSDLQKLKGKTDFFIGVAGNPNASNLKAEVGRLQRKADAGAQFIKTQPIFDIRTLERFLEAAEPVGLPIVLGIMPLVSLRFAHHIAESIPEVFVPARILKVLESSDDERTGVDIARAFMEAARPLVRGFHFFPMSKYYLLGDLLDEDDEHA